VDALIQHETYAEFLGNLRDRRNVEMDALSIDAQKEKIYRFRSSRLHKINRKDKSITDEIEKFSSRIASGELSSLTALNAFCEICKIIRKKKIMCPTAHLRNRREGPRFTGIR
jgi:peptide deformylase